MCALKLHIKDPNRLGSMGGVQISLVLISTNLAPFGSLPMREKGVLTIGRVFRHCCSTLVVEIRDDCRRDPQSRNGEIRESRHPMRLGRRVLEDVQRMRRGH